MLRGSANLLPAKWAAWSAALAIAFVTLCPLSLRPSLGPAGLERGAAFAVAGFLAAAAYPRHRILAALALIGLAILLELGQYLNPSRDPRMGDALIKSAGAVSGVVASWGSSELLRAWRRAPDVAGGV
jgi:hypothetical protein